jgi:DNA-binding response OmpR family regulator
VRVLVVEDEPALAKAIQEILASDHIESDWRETALTGFDVAITEAYDCLIFDVMLPDGSGVDLVKDVREAEVGTPILMLSVRNDVPDRVRGLNAGADDYLGKPFGPEELIARIHALARRRSQPGTTDELRVGDAILSRQTRTLSLHGQTVELSSKEFLLLEYLVHNEGQVMTRDQLMSHVWGPDSDVAENALDTYIYFLRKKCERVGLRSSIRTIRGQGYQLRP